MSSALHVITGDVHLGSRFCREGDFNQFLEALPPEATLVLNGDIVDRYQQLTPDHFQILDKLRAISDSQPVIWVRGNHDREFSMCEPASIRFVPTYAIGTRVFVTHGDLYADTMPGRRLFKSLYWFFHNLRLLLGAKPVHVAFYAQRLSGLYRLFCGYVRRGATAYARSEGFLTVVCGHTHCAEDTEMRDGIRYLNTGSWVNRRHYCVCVDADAVTLMEVSHADRD
jgi:UDP-2,3-diacylglucosamine pyrophosphatase LpxH